MVPVSLHVDDSHREGGNAIGVVMCNLGTHLTDPAARLAAITASMNDGKAAMAGMSPLQIMALSALGMSPLALAPLLGVQNMFRPPFNLVISIVPGPQSPLYYNGSRLDGVYPLAPSLDTVGPLGADVAAVELGMGLIEPGFAAGSCELVAGRMRPEVDVDPMTDAAVDAALAAAGLRVSDVTGFDFRAANSAGNALIVYEGFKVYGGQIHAVEAFMKVLPKDTPRGWGKTAKGMD